MLASLNRLNKVLNTLLTAQESFKTLKQLRNHCSSLSHGVQNSTKNKHFWRLHLHKDEK